MEEDQEREVMCSADPDDEEVQAFIAYIRQLPEDQ